MASLMLWLGLTGLALIGITWGAYPVSIWLLSLFFTPRRTEMGTDPVVSVILATRDGEGLIRRRVRNLLRTSYPGDRLEIVVAVDATAPEQELQLGGVADEAFLRIVRGPKPGGKAATLNAGVEGARGEVLVFADSRQRFAPETISELAAVFSDPRVAAASGNLILRRRKDGVSLVDLYWTFEKWIRKGEARVHSSVGITGAVSAVRASLWRPLPAGLILDDVYTPMRLVMEGYRVVFVPSAVAYETRLPAPPDEHLRKVRTQTGVLQLCAWLPSILAPRKNPIFLQFVLHKLFRLLTPFAGLMILISGAWAIGKYLPTLVLPAVVLLGGLSLWTALGASALARGMRRALAELALTQVAIVKATLNGFRGRWDVWS